MIDKINQEIKELEREINYYPENKTSFKSGEEVVKYEGWKENLPIIKAKLEQAKKDKKIIEEGLEDLKQSIEEIKSNIELNDDIRRVINLSVKIIDQKLKNQNGK